MANCENTEVRGVLEHDTSPSQNIARDEKSNTKSSRRERSKSNIVEIKSTKSEENRTNSETKNTDDKTNRIKGERKSTKGEINRTKDETKSTKGETNRTKDETKSTKGETNRTKDETKSTKGETNRTKDETKSTKGETNRTKSETKNKTLDEKASTSIICESKSVDCTTPTVAPPDVSDGRTVGDVGKPVLSKAELKAERRAQQEAQRAKKAASKLGSGPPPEKLTAVRKDNLRVRDSVTADVASSQQKVSKELARYKVPARPSATRQVGLFKHLLQYEKNIKLTENILLSSTTIHPAIVKLGVQYANGVYCGSNSRCLALLAVFKKVISDYTTPPHKELSRDLDSKIKPYISFLTQCRPMSVSMGNAIKHIKWHINNMPSHISDDEAKLRLTECIDKFWDEIVLAQQAICSYVEQKITDGDVIVVYACSSVVIKVLLKAKTTKKFRVIVIDSRPKMEGREALRRLVKAGIECSYILITATSYVMKEATKVLLGAHTLLANGYVMSRVGSSVLALAAKSCNVPVLVCCETYKFCERVQTDSFVFNELGDPNDLVTIGDRDPVLGNWRDHESLRSLNLLNLIYDVTPAEFISMVITELGMIPCTSVPVVLRVASAKIT